MYEISYGGQTSYMWAIIAAVVLDRKDWVRRVSDN